MEQLKNFIPKSEDFLPKYPNINKFKNDILNLYDKDFAEVIFLKKEFYEEKLPKIEEITESNGINLLKYQKIISKFLSSYTLYDSLLLYHEMGTGKSCTAFAVIEKIRNEKEQNGNIFKGALILGRGRNILDNLKKELVFICTKGKYIPKNYKLLTVNEKKNKINKKLSNFYSFNTYDKLIKKISILTENEIIKRYSNMIIVIDEVHNLRLLSTKQLESKKLYNQIYKFLHLIKNCKILLLSGTPMKDSPDEIANILNLILPEDQKIPIGSKFFDFYKIFDPNLNSFIVNPLFKKLIKGKISYLKSMQSNIPTHYIGQPHLGDLSYFIVYPDIMSEFQTKNYINALNIDTQNISEEIRIDGKGIYSNSRQASLFVYPDGSFGKIGFDRYIDKKRQKLTFINNKKRSIYIFKLKKNLEDELMKNIKNENDYTTILNNLKEYSTKYYETIKIILESPNKLVFLYIEFISGSGALLLSLILELFGFSMATGNETSIKKRYGILTSQTSTPYELGKIIDLFNKPQNMTGNYIQIIIGSKMISEGITLKNIQLIQILTPYWNYSEIAQAIARGIRLYSHKDLIEKGITPEINIYQHVSIPMSIPSYNKILSIDLDMYERSEKKDIAIKEIEYIIKLSSFDCALTYLRNLKYKDYSRECEYKKCQYICDGIPEKYISMQLNNKELKNNQLDYSTYQLYYNDENLKRIKDIIENMFKINFNLNFQNIIDNENIKNVFTPFEILTTLKNLIINNIIIYNKYGFPTYLREQYNIYFLVDNISDTNNIFFNFYNIYPNIISNESFKHIIDKMSDIEIPKIIEQLSLVKNKNQFDYLIDKLPLELQETFLEASYLNPNINTKLHEYLITKFNIYIYIINDIIISILLYNNGGSMRCLFNNKWINCPINIINLYNEKEQTKKENIIKNNPYGYYGIWDPNTNKFCIRYINKNTSISDARKLTTGKVCETWSLLDLLKIINKIKLDFDLNEYNLSKNKLNENELKNRIQIKVNKINWNHADFLNLSYIDLYRLYYWSSRGKSDICNQLKQWFALNNFYIIGTCGKSGKKKD